MRIIVKVIPRSSRNEVVKDSEGEYRVWVTSAPTKGEANEKLLEVLAKFFKTPKSSLRIVGGKSFRIKMVDLLLVP